MCNASRRSSCCPPVALPSSASRTFLTVSICGESEFRCEVSVDQFFHDFDRRQTPFSDLFRNGAGSMCVCKLHRAVSVPLLASVSCRNFHWLVCKGQQTEAS